jgi:trk system potassium uptake protein TrkA
MYILIGGGGVLGAALGQALVQTGHEVVVVEIDAARCENVLAPLGVVPVRGSATSIADLEKAGIRKSQVALGVMGRDPDNLAFCVLARHMRVPRIMTRMLSEQYRAPLESAGAHLIFSEIEMVLASLVTSVELPEVSGLMRIRRGGLAVFEVQIPPNARVAGLKVRDIAMDPYFPSQSLIVGMSAGADKVKVPGGNTVVEGGSSVIMVCNPQDVRAVAKFITERRELEDVEGQQRSIRKILRTFDFLKAFGDAEIDELARLSHVTYPVRGDVIFRQGDLSNEMYVLHRGRVRMDQEFHDRNKRVLAEIDAPDVFGEVGLLTGQRRLNTAVVIEDAELITLDADAFKAAAAARPDALLEVIKALTRQSEGRAPGSVPTGTSSAGFSRTGLLGSVARLLGGDGK